MSRVANWLIYANRSRQDSQQSFAEFTADELADAADRLLLLKMALKCGDLGHPAKCWRAHERWAGLVAEEFYAQGDR